jgi:hypothetical protein
VVTDGGETVPEPAARRRRPEQIEALEDDLGVVLGRRPGGREEADVGLAPVGEAAITLTSVHANPSSTSAKRRISTWVVRITHSGSPSPSRITLRSPARGIGSPPSYAKRRLAVARFGSSTG